MNFSLQGTISGKSQISEASMSLIVKDYALDKWLSTQSIFS